MTGEFVVIPKFGPKFLALARDAWAITCVAPGLGTHCTRGFYCQSILIPVRINQTR